MKRSLFADRPQELNLEFQGRGHRLSRPGMALLVLALLLTAWQVWRYQELDAEAARQEDRLGTLRHKAAQSAPAGNAAATAELPRQLAQPWDGLLRSVESALGPDIALLSVEMGGSAVKLSGEAASLEDALAFVQRLGASPVLAHPELLSHEVRPMEGRSVVGFTVRAGWRSQ